ncbi:MAG: DUF2442 domain-containing protein, partial [Chthoniobacterales bacterium]
VDLARYLNYGPVYGPLADEEFFRQLHVEAGTIAWPNGADIAPERLYELLAGYTPPADVRVPVVAEGD